MSARPTFLSAKADRHLAAALLEADTPLFNVSEDQLEEANNKLVERQATHNLPPPPYGILDVLLHDMQALKEEALIQYTIEFHQTPPVDLSVIELNEDFIKTLHKNDCLHSWCLPFDKEDGMVFIATTHYLAEAVRLFWEEKLGKCILWHVTTGTSLREGLERAVFKKEVAPAPPPMAPATVPPFPVS